MLEVNHLTVQYGAIKGVDDISFRVGKGEIVTLIGANGAGKTSTLRAISGLAKCAPGSSIQFKGQEIHNVAPHKIVEMGISHVPEGRRIFYTMSVRENILMGNYTHGMNQFKDKLDEVYTLFPRLAPLIILEIFRIIKKLQEEGKTILLIEQNANMALGIADRAYVLENGRITISGPAAEIKANEEVRKAYLGA